MTLEGPGRDSPWTFTSRRPELLITFRRTGLLRRRCGSRSDPSGVLADIKPPVNNLGGETRGLHQLYAASKHHRHAGVTTKKIARDEILASNWRAIDEQSSIIALRNSGCFGVAEDIRENCRRTLFQTTLVSIGRYDNSLANQRLISGHCIGVGRGDVGVFPIRRNNQLNNHPALFRTRAAPEVSA